MVISAIWKANLNLSYYGIPQYYLLASILRKPNSLVDCVVGSFERHRCSSALRRIPVLGGGLASNGPYMVVQQCACATHVSKV